MLTQKGKGYEAALKHPEKFHGLGPYDVATGETLPAKPGTPPNYQDVFGQAMVRLCQKDNTLVGITAAMPSGTGLEASWRRRCPTATTTWASPRNTPSFSPPAWRRWASTRSCAIYSTFLQRAYDCIVHDAALQDLPVIFCMDRAGLSANDGPTHHGLFDIAYLRCRAQRHRHGAQGRGRTGGHDVHRHARSSIPTFIRYPRGPAEGVPIKDQPRLLEIGKAEVIQNFASNGGRKVALFAAGQHEAARRARRRRSWLRRATTSP